MNADQPRRPEADHRTRDGIQMDLVPPHQQARQAGAKTKVESIRTDAWIDNDPPRAPDTSELPIGTDQEVTTGCESLGSALQKCGRVSRQSLRLRPLRDIARSTTISARQLRSTCRPTTISRSCMHHLQPRSLMFEWSVHGTHSGDQILVGRGIAASR